MPDDYPLEPDGRQMRAMGAAAVELAAEFISDIPEAGNDLEGALEAAAGLREPAPEDGTTMEAVLDVVRLGAQKSYNNSGPGMFGYVPGSGLYASAVAAFLAAATNKYVALWSAVPMYAQIETTAVRWLADMVGYPESARGVLTSGGTTSVFSGLVTARASKLGEDLTGAVLYVTEETHHAALKSAMLAGLPRRAVRTVPTTDALTMDTAALDRMVAEDRAAGLRPFCVVASAGTINTGEVDPLPDIAEICRRHELWLHVDGAYGGAFLLTERGRTAMRGIELADSVTLDPHKGFFLPYGTGALLVRDGRRLREAHHFDAAYLQDVAEESEIPNLSEYSAELSRDFRGLRLWLPIKLHGLAAFRTALDEKLDLARYAYDELKAVPGIEVPWSPKLSIVAFRYVPPSGDADAANQALLEKINESGRIHLSSTMIRGSFFLRICVLSFRTHADRMAEAVEIIQKAVAELQSDL
ncbi:pyridoxal phosphate-dependent decarboxylase family protein [Planobispora siamensis]|uniref:L-2,4-diaminobutyrate decarboxylase n=1 Tax=Planobispora siamensis TaxID=936338 RepID=A0A8J3WPS0_9ACTN|nr:aminotransferase class V-fold PLP-dependent enzyme [Planobispora siamensis]GIH97220.1 L-2,4-diaminobutyrate decarboxylase [Planobispora siamensis]